MASLEPSRRILLYEWLGFALILVALWLDELLDLPHWILGSPATPINGGELLIESLIVLPFAILVVVSTARLLHRVKHLEGLMHVCGFCNRVRDGQRWISMEEYIRSHSEAEVAQSLCHDCLLSRFSGSTRETS